MWRVSFRADPGAAVIADRHYNRQSVGSRQFVPPGACLVLRAPSALWVTSWPLAEFTKHAWAGAWVCSTFRREPGCAGLASEMITDAVAATRHEWPAIPPRGMVTFIDSDRVRPTMVRGARTWGHTYRKAGFVRVGETVERGLEAFLLLPGFMPPPEPARQQNLRLAI